MKQRILKKYRKESNSESTDLRKASDVNSRKMKWTSSDPMARYTLWLVLCTAVLSLGAVIQSCYLYRAEKATQNVQRAYLFLSDSTLLNDSVPSYPNQKYPESANRMIRYSFENYGETPGVVKYISSKCKICQSPPTIEEINSIPKGDRWELVARMIISTKQKSHHMLSRPFFLNGNDFESVVAGRQKLFFYGSFEYEDIFGNTHRTTFALEYEASNGSFTSHLPINLRN